MINFLSFLTEASGDITARQGHANEFFTNDHGNTYAETAAAALDKGASHEEAHAAGLKALMSTEYDHKKYLGDKKTKKSVETLGPTASKQVHDNSRNTAAAAAEYMFKKYGGRIKKSIWVGAGQAKAAEAETGGKKTNADIIYKIDHNNGEKTAEAHLEHDANMDFGGSLKYSSDEKDTQSKIHSPGINTLAKIIDDHHKQMFGESANLQQKLEQAREEGQEKQRRSVTDLNNSGVSHHEVISNFLDKVRANPSKYSGGDEKYEEVIRKAKYNPISNPKTNGVQGADFNDDFLSLIRKTVRNKPKGIDHKALDEFYKHVSNKNSEMRNELADITHEPIQRILRHATSDPAAQQNVNAIKESLHRHLANVHNPGEKPDQLPTLMIKTGGDGTVGLSDVNESYRQHFAENPENLSFEKKTKGKGTYRVGPGTLTMDVRPGTMHNPLTNPANYTIPSSFTKSSTVKFKDGKFDKEITPDVSNTKVVSNQNSPQAPSQPQAPSIKTRQASIRNPSNWTQNQPQRPVRETSPLEQHATSSWGGMGMYGDNEQKHIKGEV